MYNFYLGPKMPQLTLFSAPERHALLHLPMRVDLVVPVHLHVMKILTPTQAYHEKLREYHPDKRPESRGETGARAAWIESWTSWIHQISRDLDCQGHASSFGRLVHSSGEHVGESHALRLRARSIQDQEKRQAYDALWHKKRTVIHGAEAFLSLIQNSEGIL